MKSSSAKAKGRRFQQRIAERLREVFLLPDEDVRSTSMGSQGPDIWMSALARERIGFAIECKNQEKINIWAAFAQAELHAITQLRPHAARSTIAPLVVFSRNMDETLCCLKFEDFLEVLRARNDV